MAAAICADHMTGCHILHFKPAAGAFNDFLLGFQRIGLAAGAFNPFISGMKELIFALFLDWKRAHMYISEKEPCPKVN
jgi:hypothetical protein